MNKLKLIALREKLIADISKDIKMMDEEPDSMYWIIDYNLNSSMLSRVNNLLAESEVKDEYILSNNHNSVSLNSNN